MQLRITRTVTETIEYVVSDRPSRPNSPAACRRVVVDCPAEEPSSESRLRVAAPVSRPSNVVQFPASYRALAIWNERQQRRAER
jgi:hypothetical protein